MKQSTYFVIVLLSLAACTRSLEMEYPGETLKLVAKTESPADTKSVVQEETHVYWEPGDEIAVFSGTRSGKFGTSLSAASASATFSGTLGEDAWPEGMDLWAVYPYSETAAFDGGAVTAELPSDQVSRAGSFGQGMNLAVAHATSPTLQFFNVGGGVRFSLSEEGIQKVVFEGLDGEILAGTVKVGFENGAPVVLDVTEGKTSIALTPSEGDTFEKDTWYYMVTLPCTLERGFKLQFHKATRFGTRVFEKAVTIHRSRYGSLAHADEGVTFASVSNERIPFKDALVKSIVVKYFDTDEDGELSYREASLVHSFLVNAADTRSLDGMVSIFAGTDITTFDELVYFTGLTRIEDGVFAGCAELSAITIPETITSIGDNAFNGCTSLESITAMSTTPPTIGTDAFANTGECPILVPEESIEAYVAAWSEYENRIQPNVYPVPEMVDLGLPSGILWASFNLGASRPEEYGDYFAWGETSPKPVYSEATDKWLDGDNYTKYVLDLSRFHYDDGGVFSDGKSILEAEDDAAQVGLGDKWRIPTAGEIDELLRLCTFEKVTENGIICQKVTGPNGNSILIPYGGGMMGSKLWDDGQMGAYWSSSLYYDCYSAWAFGFSDDEEIEGFYGEELEVGMSPYTMRSLGMTVRPVYGDAPVLAESVSLDRSELDLTLGETAVLNVSLLPGNVTHKKVLWVTSDRRIATVTPAGEIKGVHPGEVTVAALTMDGGKWAECTVRVTVPDPVDLGLPSGIRWGTFNLGTVSPYEYGDYFMWGALEPLYEPGDAQSVSPRWKTIFTYFGIPTGFFGYTRQNDRFANFDFDGSDEEGWELFWRGYWKYNEQDRLLILESEDDVAQAMLGGDWRVPTWAEMNELRTQCTWEWMTVDGVNGRRVTGPNGNSIFLPAAGDRAQENLNYFGTDGLYWTASHCPSQNSSIGLNFDQDDVYALTGFGRYYGFSIRPVQGQIPVPVEEVLLDKSSIRLPIGGTATLRATLLPENATFTGRGLFSSISSVVSLSSSQNPYEYVVTGAAGGTTDLTVVSQDGGKSATCEVTVVDLASDLVGTYKFSSSLDAITNPWTVRIFKDTRDRQKVWFENLFADDYYGYHALFYGIVDESQGTLEIPFGQQTEYKYHDETPFTLYWLDADNNEGKDGSIMVTVLKDEAGWVRGLDFGEDKGVIAIVEGAGAAGCAYPRITAEKL